MAPIYLVLKVHCMQCWIFNANIAPYSVEKLHSDCKVLHLQLLYKFYTIGYLTPLVLF